MASAFLVPSVKWALCCTRTAPAPWMWPAPGPSWLITGTSQRKFTTTLSSGACVTFWTLTILYNAPLPQLSQQSGEGCLWVRSRGLRPRSEFSSADRGAGTDGRMGTSGGSTVGELALVKGRLVPWRFRCWKHCISGHRQVKISTSV